LRRIWKLHKAAFFLFLAIALVVGLILGFVLGRASAPKATAQDASGKKKN
jgi:uncharacterized membrane-anchored protein YhcB (DUF1043 family)